MQFLFNKKTLLGFVGFMLVVSLMAFPGGANKVVAEGGNSNLPVVQNASPLSATTANVYFGSSASMKYFAKGTSAAAGWTKSGFDDSAWGSGSAPLGYSYTGIKTAVSYGSDATHKYVTTYFRKTFTVANAADVASLAIDLLRDDGVVVYLNGKEVHRSNMATGVPAYTTYSSTCVGTTPVSVKTTIDKSALVTGTNTLAAEVHQCSANSSDLYFSVALTGQVATTSVQPTTAPTQPPVALTATKAATTVPTTAPTAAPTSAATLPPTSGRQLYVTTNGSSSGDGSASRPWSLAYALGDNSPARPGDTIWVRGGTYNGGYRVHLHGSSSAWITVRAYPNERATISYAGGPALDIYDSYYTMLWGLEVTASYSTRSTSRSESTYGIRTYQGAPSHDIKMINMVIHDMQAQGIGWWEAMSNSELYGNLFYFNGTTQLDHGVYVNNLSGTKWMINNLIFDNSSHGVHAYTETTTKHLNNLYLEGNTLFNNGSVGYTTTKSTYGTFKRNILVGGTIPANNDTVTNNYTYYPGSVGASFYLGWSGGSSGAKVTNNYFAGGQMLLGGSNTNLTMTGNSVYAPGGLSGFSASSYPNNSFASSKPTGTKIFIRPNRYETNRANVTIYNWGKAGEVSISAANLAGIALRSGQAYELHNAQNFYGDIVKGVYDGTAINVPMTGHSVAQPVGLSFKPPTTFPEFGAFVLIAK